MLLSCWRRCCRFYLFVVIWRQTLCRDIRGGTIFKCNIRRDHLKLCWKQFPTIFGAIVSIFVFEYAFLNCKFEFSNLNSNLSSVSWSSTLKHRKMNSKMSTFYKTRNFEFRNLIPNFSTRSWSSRIWAQVWIQFNNLKVLRWEIKIQTWVKFSELKLLLVYIFRTQYKK